MYLESGVLCSIALRGEGAEQRGARDLRARTLVLKALMIICLSLEPNSVHDILHLDPTGPALEARGGAAHDARYRMRLYAKRACAFLGFQHSCRLFVCARHSVAVGHPRQWRLSPSKSESKPKPTVILNGSSLIFKSAQPGGCAPAV